MMFVYALVDPRSGEGRYIGQSTTGMKRPRSHSLPSALRATSHKARWLQQLSDLGMSCEIVVLERVSSLSELNAAERWWIAYARRQAWPITNCTDGGEGMAGYRPTDETRRKLSSARIGNQNAIGNSNRRGKRARSETRERVSASLIGSARHTTPHTTSSKLKMSRSHGGTPIVDQFGNIYPSQMEAALALGIAFSNINHVLAGRRRHANGYVFTRLPADPLLGAARAERRLQARTKP